MNFNMNDQRNQMGELMQEFIPAMLSSYENMKSKDVFGITDKALIERLRSIGIPKEGRPLREVFQEMLDSVYTNQAYLQHPRCFAFIPCPVSPLSWMGDIMTSAYDLHAGSWMLSSGASCIEQEVIQWMCGLAGYPQTAGGLFVSGGSMANLTALAAARDAKLTDEERTRAVAYVSEQTHSSVAKGLHIIGFRRDQVRKIPTDSAFRMDTRALRKAIEQDTKDSHRPFVVVATAGTTNVGSIDPLTEISALCKEHDMWMHVDGAYGASILVSSKYRHLLRGIELSDSISWDAHKWLMQTYSCSAVLVKDLTNLEQSFSTHPEYLKDAAAKKDQINFWDLGPELTRPARSLKFWITLQVMGTESLGQMVEHGFQLAQWAEDELKKLSDWEIISPAQQAIINFRYAPKDISENQLDCINQQIAQEISDSGYAGIVTTELNEKKVLRICALHPETTEEEMRKTIRLLNRYACGLSSRLSD